MNDQLLTPSKISAWLECDHAMTLELRKAAGTLDGTTIAPGEFARLIMAKGNDHERACLADYVSRGLEVVTAPGRNLYEPFDHYTQRASPCLDSTADVLFQVPLIHDGIQGIADFLVRTVDAATGKTTFIPVDAKLARSEAKVGHILQLCFYVEAITAITGVEPPEVQVWLGSGRVEVIPTASVMPYWRRLRGRLLERIVGPEPATEPEPCTHCAFCSFHGICEETWRADDALHYVAGIRSSDRAALREAGVETLAALAEGPSVEEVSPERLELLIAQAELQVQARSAPEELPPFHLLETATEPGHGLALLPEPDDGDIFLDFEGHPFWRPDTGLFFLFGWIERGPSGSWDYQTVWSHSPTYEAAATRALVQHLAGRREAHPGMHVYHYNHTERSALERLTAVHGQHETALERLIESGTFVDLFAVIRKAVQAGVESYGLKHLERLAGYDRGQGLGKGASAVLEYERWMASGEQDALDAIAEYNRHDVQATRAVRDWLVSLRPADLDWAAPSVAPESEDEISYDETVEALLETDDPVHHALAHLIGYWKREDRAARIPRLAQLLAPETQLLADGETLAGLSFLRFEEPTGRQDHRSAVFSVPPQEIGTRLQEKSASVIFGTPDAPAGYSSIRSLEDDEVALSWSIRSDQLGFLPEAVAFHKTFSSKPKARRLVDLGVAWVAGGDGGAMGPTARALLGRALPRFGGFTVPGDGFSDDLDQMCAAVSALDRSVFAVQGPPGTGKTYRGARIITSLLRQGKRVGISATSYAAIDNLLAAVFDAAEEEKLGQVVRAVRKGNKGDAAELVARGLTVGPNERCAGPKFDLVCGTSWLFASDAMGDNPVDVLIIDEAGQYALADAVATCHSARSLVLLGDPLQLPQVTQAVHPAGSGLSVLDHLIGDERTMPADRGVFLSESRRMHPDVCDFISERIYEGRLHSHADCHGQTTVAGTGLRWIEADHLGCTTESPVEAELIAAEVTQLLGTEWVDQKGNARPFTTADVMVVAPYNDQVTLLRSVLDADPATAGVPVGTVDKFQGQEAAVVFFSMTTSGPDDMARGPEFLFSANRLNVAVSRARCLAHLVCTRALLDTTAGSVDQVELLSHLAAFAERCPSAGSASPEGVDRR